MANISGLVDSMLREYLLFRGFTATLKALESEIKSDKDKSFRVMYMKMLKKFTQLLLTKTIQ